MVYALFDKAKTSHFFVGRRDRNWLQCTLILLFKILIINRFCLRFAFKLPTLAEFYFRLHLPKGAARLVEKAGGPSGIWVVFVALVLDLVQIAQVFEVEMVRGFNQRHQVLHD